MNPHEHWSFDSAIRVKWVSPRVRCLFESLLKLSNYPFIDRQSLFAITDAFVRLCEAKEFKEIPSNYPYSNIVKELKDKLLGILSETKDQETIRFRLTPRKKAIIMAMRYEMANYVPALKFSDLSFGDENKSEDTEDDDEENTEKENKKKDFGTGYAGKYTYRLKELKNRRAS